VINTPRGDVTIADATLRAKLKAMPSLGVILPGEPTTNADGTRVYNRHSDKFFGMGRFRATTVLPGQRGAPDRVRAGGHGVQLVQQQASDDSCRSEARVNHGGRVWYEGDVSSTPPESRRASTLRTSAFSATNPQRA